MAELTVVMKLSKVGADSCIGLVDEPELEDVEIVSLIFPLLLVLLDELLLVVPPVPETPLVPPLLSGKLISMGNS